MSAEHVSGLINLHERYGIPYLAEDEKEFDSAMLPFLGVAESGLAVTSFGQTEPVDVIENFKHLLELGHQFYVFSTFAAENDRKVQRHKPDITRSLNAYREAALQMSGFSSTEGQHALLQVTNAMYLKTLAIVLGQIDELEKTWGYSLDAVREKRIQTLQANAQLVSARAIEYSNHRSLGRIACERVSANETKEVVSGLRPSVTFIPERAHRRKNFSRVAKSTLS